MFILSVLSYQRMPVSINNVSCDGALVLFYFILIFPISFSRARRKIGKRDVHFLTIGFEPLVEFIEICYKNLYEYDR